jgi:hypothetical protein
MILAGLRVRYSSARHKACAYLLTVFTDAINTATEACAYLLTTPTNAIKADLFIYNTIAKSRYTSIVFIGIMVNTSASKKSIASYKQF